MNRIGLIVKWVGWAGLAMLAVASAHAQQRYDPAIPGAVLDQRVEPAGELTQPARAATPPRLVQNVRRSNRDADARQCLSLPTNRQVHRCSLKYRAHASRPAVVKAASKPSAAASSSVSIEPAQPAEMSRAGPMRPGDAAKAADLVKPMDVSKAGGTPKALDTTAKAPEPVKPAVPPPAATAPAKTAAPAPAKAPEPVKK